jgi:hypothetical protein
MPAFSLKTYQTHALGSLERFLTHAATSDSLATAWAAEMARQAPAPGPGERLVAGRWPNEVGECAVETRWAERLGVGIGSRLVFDVQGVEVATGQRFGFALQVQVGLHPPHHPCG